jgi:DNA-binding response OmpR family regulator
MRILILEDDSMRVNTFIELLHNHQLDITENAYDAIDLLDEKAYDLILLDNDLGEGNGSGTLVAAYLAQLSELRATIIIHSWNAPASNAMTGYLPQAYQAPFNTESFYELINQVKDQK